MKFQYFPLIFWANLYISSFYQGVTWRYVRMWVASIAQIFYQALLLLKVITRTLSTLYAKSLYSHKINDNLAEGFGLCQSLLVHYNHQSPIKDSSQYSENIP